MVYGAANYHTDGGFREKNQFCILSPGMVYQLSVRCEVVWIRMSGGLDTHSFHSPLGCFQRVIWKFDVYPGTGAGLESS